MKYLILGAGPAGLTVANYFKDNGINDFLVLEKEEIAGGLCRSIEVDNAPFDIGGGHFLDVKRPIVNEFLFNFLPKSEWNLFNRDSRIFLKSTLVGHPLEANIWQLNIKEQVEYLKSISLAGCNTGKPMPSFFTDWIYWKLGDKIAKEYMIPYNQKIFHSELNQLGTYWMNKLPNVSFDETLLSCLTKKAYGSQPGHAQFYYPKKYGYGELWKRMAYSIKNNILYNKQVYSIDFDSKTILTTDQSKYSADIIISTIPWLEFSHINGMPKNIKNSLANLKFSSIQTAYYPRNLEYKCHWIYYPDPQLPYHRILLRHNFCNNSKGYWTETNLDRININNNDDSKYKYINKYAYPLNTIDKPEIMETLLGWSKKKGVIGLGRWGEHQHYNSDVTVELALRLAKELVSYNESKDIISNC